MHAYNNGTARTFCKMEAVPHSNGTGATPSRTLIDIQTGTVSVEVGLPFWAACPSGPTLEEKSPNADIV